MSRLPTAPDAGDQQSMTTIQSNVDAATIGGRLASAEPSLASAIADWITTSDHKKIGRLFIGSSLLFAVGVSVLGGLLGFERMSATSYSVLEADAVVQLFSAYQFALVYAVVAPLFVGLAIAVVPLQLGSRSLSYPRLASFGLWAWVSGLIVTLVSIAANGGPGGGNPDMVDLYLLALGLVALGLSAASVSIVVTVLTSRAPGMSLLRTPMFSWSALMGAMATVLTMPVLIGTLVYTYVDHANGRLAFGGNTDVSKWIGWSFTQPQTFVFAVMAVGVLAELAPIVANVRQPLRPVMLFGVTLVSTAALGGATQSTHSFSWNGTIADKVKELIPFALFNLLPILGVLIVLALGGLAAKNGRVKLTASFVFAFLGTGMLFVGMLVHALSMIGPAALAGTVAQESSTLYVVYGAVMVALGAVAHWGPKLWGRCLPKKEMFGLAALALLATILSSLPLVLAGFLDQPSNVVAGWSYDASGLLNAVSMIGHGLMLVTVLGFIGLAFKNFTSGAFASDDPWDAHSLEWSIPSPAPAENFSDIAIVGSAEPLLDVKPARQGVSA